MKNGEKGKFHSICDNLSHQSRAKFELFEADFTKKFSRFTELSVRKLLFSISKDVNYCLLASFTHKTQHYVDLRCPKSIFNSFSLLRISAEASILMKSRKHSKKFLINLRLPLFGAQRTCLLSMSFLSGTGEAPG